MFTHLSDVALNWFTCNEQLLKYNYYMYDLHEVWKYVNDMIVIEVLPK